MSRASRQGDVLFWQNDNVASTAWKDKKIVHFISTQSNPVGEDSVHQCNETVIQVPTVPIAKSYIKSMGSHNQMHGYYAQ